MIEQSNRARPFVDLTYETRKQAGFIDLTAAQYGLDVDPTDPPSPSTVLGNDIGISDDEFEIESNQNLSNEFTSRVTLSPEQNVAIRYAQKPVSNQTTLQRKYHDRYRLQSGLSLAPHMDVELMANKFLRIHSIFEVQDDHGGAEVFLEGFLFLPMGIDEDENPVLGSILVDDIEDLSNLHVGNLPNELFWFISLLGDDKRNEKVQSLRTFSLSEFVRIRQIRMTNQLYPDLNPLAISNNMLQDLEDEAVVLVCRWKGIKKWPSAKDRKSQTLRYCSRTVARLRERECDPPYRVEDAKLMQDFRGPSARGGSQLGVDEREVRRRDWEKERESEAERRRPPNTNTGHTIILDTPPQIPIEIPDGYIDSIVLDDDHEESHDADSFWKETSSTYRPWINNGVRRYTFADIFCGFGGTTRAAVTAGLSVEYGVDIEKAMCESYHKNFPWTRIACCDAQKFVFCGTAYRGKRVDILHLSNPCQPFSKAHTTPGRNDEINRRNIYLFEEYLRQCQPRVVTVENADGILNYKHWSIVQCLIRQFTSLNYSVEFRIVHFRDYGLCQPRRRFVLVASCPGQRLPGIAMPTHCDPERAIETGRPSWIGVGDAIDHIPDEWPEHDLVNAKIIDGQPYSRDGSSRTLITKNSYLLHYQGFRKYTMQELLQIQGFPLWHEFGTGQCATLKEKQVGNAVPPKVFSVFFDHIRKELLKDDGLPTD